MMLRFWDLISYFEDSALADNIRENDLLFPLIESVHVLSICLVVGSILAVDLRLLGLASINRPVSRVSNGILPLTWSAFAIAVASGGLLFISNAAASGTARRRIVHSAMGFGGHLRALDRIHHGGSLR